MTVAIKGTYKTIPGLLELGAMICTEFFWFFCYCKLAWMPNEVLSIGLDIPVPRYMTDFALIFPFYALRLLWEKYGRLISPDHKKIYGAACIGTDLIFGPCAGSLITLLTWVVLIREFGNGNQN
jgi:hypothetical protein